MHNRRQTSGKQRLRQLIPLFLTLLLPLNIARGSTVAQAATVQAVTSQLTTAFTYQGQLKRDGTPFSGTCDFQFGLWDADAAGAQQGETQNVTGVAVADGLFTAQLDFGSQFTGDARWLEVQVKCEGDDDYTTLTPRVLLTATPYAMSLVPGAEINGAIASTSGVLRVVNQAEGAAILGLAAPTTGATYGVLGNAFSPGGIAVSGYTENGGTAIRGLANDTGIGVFGESMLFEGVRGLAHDPNHGAVVGIHDGGGFGVFGTSDQGAGVVGKSTSWVGIYGESQSAFGAQGKSDTGAGVVGTSTSWIGVYGESTQNEGVRGVSHSSGFGGVVGYNDKGGPGIYGKSDGNGFAIVADGKLSITGGGDVAERFANADGQRFAPGSLVVVDEAHPGQLKLSNTAYDHKVMGVISGAGGVEPGLILHQTGVLEGDLVVAITGRVYCNAEAVSAPIAPGDLLTTSSQPGYCMKATDRERAYGAIIGKALTGLDAGTGQVLILVNLQ
ncbi:MAG: hypothetical protein U0175_31565 [Caldilineaceae bacterium]